ncbi:MAG: hypothetical protein ACPGVO_08565 [Spirulinaceae cyanobacterium]
MRSAKFLEGLSGGVAEQWVANLLTPAFVFWVGGFIAVFQHETNRKALREFLKPWSETQEIGLLIFALLIVALSSFVMQRFDFIALRWLEGYWPRWLRPLRDRFIKQQRRRKHRAQDRCADLDKKRDLRQLNANEAEDLARFEHQLQYLPKEDENLMPTRLGNILRAAEETPDLRYGLDPVLCWPHLWLILPEQTRADVATARQDLDTSVRVLLWGLLFIIWTAWAWWAFPVGIIVTLFAYGWSCNSAVVYADLLVATFTLHRFALYQDLNWSIPTSPAEEKKLAAQLNAYLAWGDVPDNWQYHLPEA